MKALVLAILVAAAAALVPGAGMAQECGRVTIADMNWQSAEVLAHIDQIILAEGFGCEAELVAGDTVPSFTSMSEKGEPDIAPELWVGAVREPLEKALGEGRLVDAGEPLKGGGVQGWYVPKYIVEANPSIKTIADALKHPELFPAPEDEGKGAVHNCPSGWACETLTANLFRANEADKKGFVLVDTGSAAGLDGSIARAFERQEGWLGYYWAPTSILGKYDMVRLDDGVPHDSAQWESCTTQADCPAPKPNAFVVSEIKTVVTKAFAERDGGAADYIRARTLDLDTINGLLAFMSDNQATGAEGAEHFLKENVAVWSAWVPEDVAAKVKKHLKIAG